MFLCVKLTRSFSLLSMKIMREDQLRRISVRKTAVKNIGFLIPCENRRELQFM